MTIHFVIKRTMAAGAGLLGIVLVSGSMLLLSTPGRSLAQEPTTSDSHQADMPVQEHAPIGTSLLDFQLPGTQPGGLTTALADSGSCTGCHVDHIRDNFNGAMMSNGVRESDRRSRH